MWVPTHVASILVLGRGVGDRIVAEEAMGMARARRSAALVVAQGMFQSRQEHEPCKSEKIGSCV